MKKTSKSPAPRHLKQRDVVEIEERFEVITPMFGGGVFIDPKSAHDKKPDPLTPVRAASVRGQLRFWWRATQAHRFPTIEQMRKEEAELWGAASAPALVALDVASSVRVSPIDASPSGGIGYGAFPLRPVQGGPTTGGKLTKLEGESTLRLRVPPTAEAQVREALDAWLLFGGVGGRSRRGFGAVAIVGRALEPMAFLKPYAGRRALAGLSSLGGARLVVGARPFDSSRPALESALGALRDFRQEPGVGRNDKGRKTPGRSFWPEPETIRALTGDSSERHSDRPINVSKFPRAAFGMPIIFHFKNDRADRQREPGDTHLLPKGLDRRASPLIVRPVRVGSRFVAIALTLVDPARATEKLILREKKGRRRDFEVESSIHAHEVGRISPLRGEPDPLVAFLNFFAAKHAH